MTRPFLFWLLGFTLVSSAALACQFPFCQGPSSTTIGDLACWNSTNGTLLKDCGTLPAAAQSCPSITQYGGGPLVSDNSAALTAAFAAQGDQTCVSFPPGKHHFLSAFSHTYSGSPYASVTLQGSGADVTELIGPTGSNGFTFTLMGAFNSVHIRDLSIETPSACSACTGLALTQGVSPLPNPADTALSDITNINIYGTDRVATGPATNYWETGIKVNSVSNINFTGVYLQGIESSSPPPAGSKGIWVVGTTSDPNVVYNLIGVSVNSYYYGFYIDSNTQGVTVASSNFTDNFYGIYVPATTGAQLAVTGSQLNNCSNITFAGSGVYNVVMITGNYFITGASPFSCSGSLTSVDFSTNGLFGLVSNNTFGGATVTGTIGINTGVSNFDAGVITGNFFTTLGVGINLAATAQNAVITGNGFNTLTTGIQIQNGAFEIRVADNNMVNVTNRVSKLGTAFGGLFIDEPLSCNAQGGFTFGGAAVGLTYSSQNCWVSVRGLVATVDFDYTLSAVGSSTGAALFNLPYTPSANTPGGSGVVSFAGPMTGLTGPIMLFIPASSAAATLELAGSTGYAPVTNANFTNTSHVIGEATIRMLP